MKLHKAVIITGGSASGKTTLHCCLTVNYGLVPNPVHTTRPKRRGELHGVDAMFLSDEEYFTRFGDGLYLEKTPQSTWFSGAYYGSPRTWIAEPRSGQANCFVCPTIRIATMVKRQLQARISWIHLFAIPQIREDRLRRREPQMSLTTLRERVASGSRKVDIELVDGVIDTSFLKPKEIIEKAEVIIRSLGGN